MGNGFWISRCDLSLHVSMQFCISQRKISYSSMAVIPGKREVRNPSIGQMPSEHSSMMIAQRRFRIALNCRGRVKGFLLLRSESQL